MGRLASSRLVVACASSSMWSKAPARGDRSSSTATIRSSWAGRGSSIAPMPEDSALSRDHFLIEIKPPRCELRDLGSTNGTFVNDQRVEPGEARLGRPDRGRPERLPGPDRGGVRRLGRRRPAGREETAEAAGAGRPDPLHRLRRRRPRPGVDIASGSHPDWRESIPGSATPAGPTSPPRSSRCRTTPPSASWAEARWASSTSPSTTHTGRKVA